MSKVLERISKAVIQGDDDEIADYTYAYTDGTTVKTVSIIYYEGNLRAESASSADAMFKQDAHRASNIGIAEGDKETRTSTTYFNNDKGRGNEIADYSANYGFDGESVKNISIFYYKFFINF